VFAIRSLSTVQLGFASVVRSRDDYRRRIMDQVRQFSGDLDRQDTYLLALI
jgi:hypothetical protein